MRWRFGAVAALSLLVLAPSAAATPPPNDNRANATAIDVPTTVSGSTAGATKASDDPSVYCGNADGTLWYKVVGPPRGRLIVRFSAAGDLDAYVAVFKVVRSRISLQNCDATDTRGKAAFAFNAEPGSTYLIEVARLVDSPDASFQFRLFQPEPSSRPPGKPLPRRGVTSTVDPLVDFDDAWSFSMKPGIAYKINLAPARGKCVGLLLYRPGTHSFAGARPVHSLGCGGYLTLTPGPDTGGRYALLVMATGTRAGPEGYHLAAARAGDDDKAPGIPLTNLQTRRGSLNARGLDVVDLYRFDVETRSDVTLRLRAAASSSFDLLLLGETGRRFGCECGDLGSQELTARLEPGHYFAVVRARRFTHGRYALSLLVRQITSTQVAFSGDGRPGQAASVTAHVTFATAGRVTIRIERFDPLMGWQFARRYRLRLSAGGTASASFVPPTVGRWRARAFYSGTRTTSPSKSGFATLVVE